ncbi:hypothetical protein FCM35_KLT09760 [Carex littledalei]|uniref:Uncharacterized protein n=1 Tax=Carex littledalei TaxID=544730 RepID=A0A833VK77_9POAL|nr:hypothetical protein FCM35_KLT09760 [Carex littledalei]
MGVIYIVLQTLSLALKSRPGLSLSLSRGLSLCAKLELFTRALSLSRAAPPHLALPHLEVTLGAASLRRTSLRIDPRSSHLAGRIEPRSSHLAPGGHSRRRFHLQALIFAPNLTHQLLRLCGVFLIKSGKCGENLLADWAKKAEIIRICVLWYDPFRGDVVPDTPRAIELKNDHEIKLELSLAMHRASMEQCMPKVKND